MIRILVRAGLAASVACLCVGTLGAECPSAEEILDQLDQLDLTLGSRTTELELEPPKKLYRKASRNVGDPVVDRQGKKILGVVVVALPAESLWKAVNDEEHHALNGYLPVEHSEVIGGTPRGTSRLLFQYFSKFGLGRWWISQVEINTELFHVSDGRLWEVRWEDGFDRYDTTQPPVDAVAETVQRLKTTRGAWLFIPLSDSCTMIEYASWTDPGGALGLGHGLLAGGAIRDTLEAITRMAREHIPTPHPGADFVRPDGSPFEPRQAAAAQP
jgi:hypothetical protein